MARNTKFSVGNFAEDFFWPLSINISPLRRGKCLIPKGQEGYLEQIETGSFEEITDGKLSIPQLPRLKT